ncbi:bile acid:sodium symporter family protein [Methylomarinum vadi]|uniref:bile acid:sodium symporter family protein n=1 Tax=Methylomarinum vadi TaxID=438855 RepID=UPI0004DF0BD4|nr:bile acid:sodium symporter family protein [Methylomarinum vadi]
MMRGFVGLFPLWAILLAVAAYVWPQPFAELKNSIVPLLALVMFCMGMTLTWRDFMHVLKQPAIVFMNAIIQFGCMPLFAWLIALVLQLPPAIMVGMVLVGASAGGTASNVICYMAQGNVALSVLMTMVSTLCAVVLMPLLTWLYLNTVVTVPVADMLRSILTVVLLPVLAGTLINSLLHSRLRKVETLFPLLSTLAIIVIIAIIVGLNQPHLGNVALPAIIAVILHNSLGLATGYWVVRLLKYDESTARTVAIEVGMQNSGLSVALAVQYFSGLAALPGALFSIWHNLSGSLLAFYWRRTSDQK